MAHESSTSRRTRFGITLWVISYLPLPVVAAGVLHFFGVLSSKADTATFITVTWTIQIIIGFIGLALAGATAISLIRKQGVRKLPANFWRVLKGGELQAENRPTN